MEGVAGSCERIDLSFCQEQSVCLAETYKLFIKKLLNFLFPILAFLKFCSLKFPLRIIPAKFLFDSLPVEKIK